MAFSFDSLCALVLWLTAIWAWWMARPLRAPARVPLRFAAALLSAQAVSLMIPAPGLAFNVALIAGSVAGTALALGYCFPRSAPPWLSGSLLTLALAFGLMASLAAMPILAVGGIAAAAACILAANFTRLHQGAGAALIAMLGASALFLSGPALMDGAVAQAMLLAGSALGLVTRASEKPVADANARVEFPVGGKRA
jgi:hypothetical protein